MDAMVDWQLASKVAEGVAALQPSGDPKPFQAVAGPAEESARLVSAYTGLVAESLPAAEAVDRAAWVDANLQSMRGILDPAARKATERMGPLGGVVGSAAGAVLGVEAGAISGFLAGRVLGQYEFPVLDPAAPARLLFVAPNLGHAATQLDSDADRLLRWVALHESTHALQFGGVPWLREHLADLVRELTGALDLDPGKLFGSLPGLDDLPSLRTAMQRRRRDRSGLLRVLERLIGMDLKMRQYEQGKAFCDGVVARGGIEALNRVWDGPDAMPSIAELDDPAGWLARTEQRRLRQSA